MTHKLFQFIALILLLSQIALLGFIYVQYALRSSGKFYSVTADNQVKELNWLYRPNANVKSLLSWATMAATASYTLDFVNYQNNLDNLKQYFTEDGYNSYLLGLDNNAVLQTIQDKKLVVSAVTIGPAIVSAENEVHGFHTWQVEVPLTVSYLSASEQRKQNILVSMLITEVPTDQANTGIGIAQYVATNLSPEVTR